MNLYAYVANDPLNNIDPDGKRLWKIVTGPARIYQSIKRAYQTYKKNKQLARNKEMGKKGEDLTREKLGDDVAGEQVTFKTSDGTRTRADFVTKDKKVVETKTGDAKLSKGQEKLKGDIDAGNDVTPVGKNAEKAGLEPGQPTKMNGCSVDRPC